MPARVEPKDILYVGDIILSRFSNAGFVVIQKDNGCYTLQNLATNANYKYTRQDCQKELDGVNWKLLNSNSTQPPTYRWAIGKVDSELVKAGEFYGVEWCTDSTCKLCRQYSGDSFIVPISSVMLLLHNHKIYKHSLRAVLSAGINGEMGKDSPDGLCWRTKNDMAVFKSQTDGNVCIVGSNTYAKLPNLPNRRLIVVGKKYAIRRTILPKGAMDLFVPTLTDALDVACCMSMEAQTICAIGGAQLIGSMVQTGLIDSFAITRINAADADATTFFDERWLDGFELDSSMGLLPDEIIKQTLQIWQRRK